MNLLSGFPGKIKKAQPAPHLHHYHQHKERLPFTRDSRRFVVKHSNTHHLLSLIHLQARATFPANAAFVIPLGFSLSVNLAHFGLRCLGNLHPHLMTSTSQQSTTSRSKPAPSATGAPTSNLANGSNLAAPGRTSLPSATDSSSFKPNASEPNKMSAAVGGAPSTHSHSESVNGRNPTIPAIPSVNGNVSLPDPTGKPSMTVTPVGTTSFTANGVASAAPQNKPGIQFGSMGMANANSPAMGTPSLAHQNSSNLGVTQLNPGAASPSGSPSPIPQPAVVSGGRPPSSFQGQGNGYTFGQMPTPADPSDPSVRKV